jgi:hypothetical protein
VRRISVLLCLALVAALALGACNAQFTPDAARVGGVAVPQSALDAALDSVAGDPGFRCLVEASDGGASGVVGVAPGTYNASFAASELTLLIRADAIHDIVGRLGLPDGSFAAKLASNQFEHELQSELGSTCNFKAAKVFSLLGGAYRAALIGYWAGEFTLAAHVEGVRLTAAGVTAYERNHRGSAILDCTRVIVVASRSKAAQLAIAINGGVSFAKVARLNSLDTSTAERGGNLGCGLPTTLALSLRRAVVHLALGRLSSPVRFGKYWLLLEVTRRPVAPLMDVALGVVSAGSTAAGKQATAGFDRAQVSVNPAYGTWVKVSGAWEVRPPSGPPVDLVPNPSAVGAGSTLGG